MEEEDSKADIRVKIVEENQILVQTSTSEKLSEAEERRVNKIVQGIDSSMRDLSISGGGESDKEGIDQESLYNDQEPPL